MSKESSGNGMIKAWEATVKRTQLAAKRRANTIFGTTMSSAAITPSAGGNDDDDDEDYNNENDINTGGGGVLCEVYHAEKVLPNGDYYTGQWSDSFPHGQGKYLWTDGCMYVGEWFRGKSTGRGRFSWPSGAIYEGEFKSGYMDGTGTYTSPNGDTYKGQWVMNLKHGHGVNSYFNGDIYDGEWRRGSQEGRGRYQWRDGNCYVGEWKNGEICGKGVLMWRNGKRYDGFWEDGVPKGNGTFKWPDGSFYVGNWSKDPREQNGTYYPSGSSPDGNLEWDPQEVFDHDLSECRVRPCEKVSILPSQKRLAVWRSSKGGDGGGGERPRRFSVDGRMSVAVERPFDRMKLWGGGGEECGVEGLAGLGGGVGQPMTVFRKGKRQGETICKGHKNYELMLNLQLGIR